MDIWWCAACTWKLRILVPNWSSLELGVTDSSDERSRHSELRGGGGGRRYQQHRQFSQRNYCPCWFHWNSGSHTWCAWSRCSTTSRQAKLGMDSIIIWGTRFTITATVAEAHHNLNVRRCHHCWQDGVELGLQDPTQWNILGYVPTNVAGTWLSGP